MHFHLILVSIGIFLSHSRVQARRRRRNKATMPLGNTRGKTTQRKTRHPTANNFTNDLASLTMVYHAAQTERQRLTSGVTGWNRKATGILMRCTNPRFYQKVARDAVSMSLLLLLCILIHSDHIHKDYLPDWLVTWQQVHSEWLQKMPINAITDQVQFTAMPCKYFPSHTPRSHRVHNGVVAQSAGWAIGQLISLTCTWTEWSSGLALAVIPTTAYHVLINVH